MNMYYFLEFFLGLLTWDRGPVGCLRDGLLRSKNLLALQARLCLDVFSGVAIHSSCHPFIHLGNLDGMSSLCRALSWAPEVQ